MKHALNPLTDAIEQAVKASGMLDDLVHTFGRDHTITGLVLDSLTSDEYSFLLTL